jgi:hypothetical protein
MRRNIVAETDNASNTSTPVPVPLIEGYQAIKGYQPTHLERGYQATVTVTPSQPPQGGSVIAAPGPVTGTSPQGATALPPITPPQGGSVIAPSAPVAEQK